MKVFIFFILQTKRRDGKVKKREIAKLLYRNRERGKREREGGMGKG